MESFDWTTVLIIATVGTIALLILAMVWRLLKRFLKIWFVLLLILVLVKLAYDAGFLGSV